jgi:hypothetical protein
MHLAEHAMPGNPLLPHYLARLGLVAAAPSLTLLEQLVARHLEQSHGANAGS